MRKVPFSPGRRLSVGPYHDPAWLAKKGRLCVCAPRVTDRLRRPGTPVHNKHRMSDRINSLLKAETTNTPLGALVCPYFLGLFMRPENELMYNYPVCVIFIPPLTSLPSQAEKPPPPPPLPCSVLCSSSCSLLTRLLERHCQPGMCK